MKLRIFLKLILKPEIENWVDTEFTLLLLYVD